MGKNEKTLPAAEPEFRDAMRNLIGRRWGALWEAVPVAIEGTDIEGVHDVRVASRRLRAAMDVSTDAFPNQWFRQLHRVAKEITTALGGVRDRDVLLEELTRKRNLALPGEHPGFDRLIARQQAEREDARKTMLAFLQGLEHDDVAEESIKRFGEAARAPWLVVEDKTP